MRQAFFKKVISFMEADERVCLLLGDISVHGFEEAFRRWPARTWNVGICEQSMVSMAAGLARAGMFPIVHSIAPFIVDRALEQIRIDFGYQHLPGMFVTVGASFDYSTLGATHQAPQDVEVMKSIPNMHVYVPWDDIDAANCLTTARARYDGPTYVRLAQTEGTLLMGAMLGRRSLQRDGKKGTVIVVGTMLPTVMRACSSVDCAIIYLNCVAPFPTSLVQAYVARDDKTGDILPILTVEPYFKGGIVRDLHETFFGKRLEIYTCGVERAWHHYYGTPQQHKTINNMHDAAVEAEARGVFCE